MAKTSLGTNKLKRCVERVGVWVHKDPKVRSQKYIFANQIFDCLHKQSFFNANSSVSSLTFDVFNICCLFISCYQFLGC